MEQMEQSTTILNEAKTCTIIVLLNNFVYLYITNRVCLSKLGQVLKVTKYIHDIPLFRVTVLADVYCHWYVPLFRVTVLVGVYCHWYVPLFRVIVLADVYCHWYVPLFRVTVLAGVYCHWYVPLF